MKAPAFRFQNFSRKQLQILTWWTKPSPYRDWDGIIADGSVRSGKTIAFIDGFITWSLSEFQGEAFILAGKSMGALKRNVLRPMFQILRAKQIGYAYNRSENYVQIGSNTYYCFGANNEASQDVLQGLTAAGAMADEGALFPESFLEQMFARCSVDRAKVWINCNPESPYHYVKTEIIDKAKAKRFLHLHLTMDDNLTLSERVKERFRRMYSGVWFKRFVLGLWVAAQGAVYDNFDAAVHVVKNLPLMTRYWVCVDYGTANPCVFYLVGQGADNCLYVISEYRYSSADHGGRQRTDAQYSKDFRDWLGNIIPQWVFVDPSAASFLAQLQSDGVRRLAKADNDVLNGIRRTSALLGNGKLKIHESCTSLIKEISSYVWDDKAQLRGEDAPKKENDHGPDAIRYLVNGTRHIWAPWIRYRERTS